MTKLARGIFVDLQCASLFPGSKQVSENATLSSNDRRANKKAVFACFVAENSLLFSLTPKLVELCQTLAKDRPALSKLKMERTAATYITGHGVAKTMREELVAKLNKNYFSMNVDEATNNKGDKIINVLVRVHDDEKEKIITVHLGSRNENISTANHIFLHLKELLDSNEISFSKKYTETWVKSYNQQSRSNGQICQEISREEVIIDKNQDFAQKCRKAIREIMMNNGNDALISSRTNELLSYEAKIAESEAALISIGPCLVMSCTEHHEAVKDVEMDGTNQLVDSSPLIFRQFPLNIPRKFDL
ncbi:hypothetical protein AVEN_243228-1 [Araneus ventricosus]|uniref:DUF4371 domain-containing protein n=1 Tax=Araneus ventricosus TaxID=182803 RepID=A0A4Y2IT33_ARAVE|nr:hypothetical protein AVEN_243228-1 [Araneus ventricosus]